MANIKIKNLPVIEDLSEKQSKSINGGYSFRKLDSTQFGLDPARFGLDPARFGLDPARFGLDPFRFGTDEDEDEDDSSKG